MKRKWRRRIKKLEDAVIGLTADAKWEPTDDVMTSLDVGKEPEEREAHHPFAEPLARILHIECVGGHAGMTWEKVGNKWRRFADWLLEDPDHVIHGRHRDRRNEAVLSKLRKLGVCRYSKYVSKVDSDEIHAKTVERVARWAYRMHCAKKME